jgi:hypothetical protein
MYIYAICYTVTIFSISVVDVVEEGGESEVFLLDRDVEQDEEEERIQQR